MSVGILVYLLFGLCYVLLEHRLLEDTDQELTRRQKILGTLQLVVHYVRLALVWPLYLLEDGLLYIEAMGDADDEEGEE